ncbi:glucose 1-dehydrogenase [Candidatus Berkiella aquae]|uniref:Cyclopentanol dehydrogenase n=1 Tax=Candidatus Berkiella aquae TaxID=295108 RepID=A0A0Q9YLA6_9GAMM|nr:glucose 1-dehydrogenase [Candidatus Berkiella aquae]MCS5711477.1 glucose 1-dehydrogenase [Candidatus Berkiella aquae]
MDRVKNKVAIVTGGALGIGRSASILLAQEGAKVAITDINQEEGEKLAESIQQDGGQAKFWLMNTATEKDVKNTFKDIEEKFGRIDTLVNNAGIAGVNKPTDEVTEEEWDKVTSVNVKGVFFCTKHVIPYMRKVKGGSIINLSSIYGLIGAPDLPPYHASKGAVTLMTKTDALFYAKDKIRVNSIHPGYIWTPLVAEIADKFDGGKKAFLNTVGPLHALGHIGEPDDIGWGIVYLASDESKFMTGSELVIDGGYTAK